MYTFELQKLLNENEANTLPDLAPVAIALRNNSRPKGKYVWRGEKCATMEYLLSLVPDITFGDFSPLNQTTFDILVTELELDLTEYQTDFGSLVQVINDVANDSDRKSCAELLENKSK